MYVDIVCVCAYLEWPCLTQIFARYKTFILLLIIIVETVNVTNFAGVCPAEGYGDDRQDTLEAFPFSQQPVSYTHLTLPTIVGV